MMIPNVDEMMFEINRCSNPYYKQGYYEGYEQAKEEMMEKLKLMQAFYDTATSVAS